MTIEGKKWETEFPTKCEPHTHKIFYEFFFESQQIQNTELALHPHTRTNMMNEHTNTQPLLFRIQKYGRLTNACSAKVKCRVQKEREKYECESNTQASENEIA